MKRILSLLLALVLLLSLAGCGAAKSSEPKSREELEFRTKLTNFNASANRNLNDLYFICSTMQKYLAENDLSAGGRFDELAAYVKTVEPSVDFDAIADRFGILTEYYKTLAADEWGKENAEKILKQAEDAVTAIYGLGMCVGEPSGTAANFKKTYNGYEDDA